MGSRLSILAGGTRKRSRSTGYNDLNRPNYACNTATYACNTATALVLRRRRL
jgi:hypothetical protein